MREGRRLYPRMREADGNITMLTDDLAPLPPHRQGRHAVTGRIVLVLASTPAYAGLTPGTAYAEQDSTLHPHVRGADGAKSVSGATD